MTGLPVFKPEGLPFRCRQCLHVSILSAASTNFPEFSQVVEKIEEFSGSGRVFRQDPEAGGAII
jgi:hypothetical protein